MEILLQLLKQNPSPLRCRKTLTRNNNNWSMHRFWHCSQGPHRTKTANCRKNAILPVEIKHIAHIQKHRKVFPGQYKLEVKNSNTIHPTRFWWILVSCYTATSSVTRVSFLLQTPRLKPVCYNQRLSSLMTRFLPLLFMINDFREILQNTVLSLSSKDVLYRQNSIFLSKNILLTYYDVIISNPFQYWFLHSFHVTVAIALVHGSIFSILLCYILNAVLFIFGSELVSYRVLNF